MILAIITNPNTNLLILIVQGLAHEIAAIKNLNCFNANLTVPKCFLYQFRIRISLEVQFLIPTPTIYYKSILVFVAKAFILSLHFFIGIYPTESHFLFILILKPYDNILRCCLLLTL